MMDGEIVARVERRRRWSAAEKAALLGEVEAEGGRVAVVARRHGISRSLLHEWRSVRRAAGGSQALGARGFIQIGVVGDGSDGRVAACASAVPASRGAGLALAERVGVIEIDLPGDVRIRLDGGVNEQALRRVLLAVRQSR